MFRNILAVTRDIADLYSDKRIPRASAALSYYLTMTVFPLIICLYSLLGKNYSLASDALDFAAKFLAPETTEFLREFLRHVASSNSPAMLAAGLTVLITSSSAAIRTLQTTIGEMQGGQRFQGFVYFLLSMVFSLVFLAAMYFSVVVIVTGQEVLTMVNNVIPVIDFSRTWGWLRFLLLAGIVLVIFWGVYAASKRRIDKYRTFPGALLAMAAAVVMSAAFSIFIGASAKYPLIYGSLASVILLMLWLYISCQIIFVGAAFNIALQKAAERRLEAEREEDED